VVKAGEEKLSRGNEGYLYFYSTGKSTLGFLDRDNGKIDDWWNLFMTHWTHKAKRLERHAKKIKITLSSLIR
jgi:hypothetical protein